MSKIVDPILDYFLQIPLSEGNILKFLFHNGFNISKVQHPDGSMKAFVFYNISYPSKSVQFKDSGEGVENFLNEFQHSLFFILDEIEMTFVTKTPRGERGIAIQKSDEEMMFLARNVSHSGEKLKNFTVSSLSKAKLNLTKNSLNSSVYSIPHKVVQKIFMAFIQKKRLLKLEDIEN